MYAREVAGQELTFGVSGKLIRNVLVMYDRETETYWSQLLGEGVEGELVGYRLTFLPSWFTTWEQWRAAHPDTLALSKSSPSAFDPYVSYYQSDRTGIIPETIPDERLYVKEFVVGVELDDGLAKAYPFRVLNDEPVVNDQIGETDVLVVFTPQELAMGLVYERRVDGQTLTFSRDESAAGFTLVDAETGSRWLATTGQAVAGPLAGATLRRLKSTVVFWFGWTDFHPDTLVYEGAG